MKVVVALALIFGTALGNKYDKNIEVSVKDTAVPTLEAMHLGGTIETQLREQLTVGGEYEQTEAMFKPRALFAKWTSGSGGNNPLSMKTTYNVAANSAALEVDYEHSSGARLEAKVDTGRANWVKRVALAKTVQFKGRDLSFNPSYDFAAQMTSLKTRLSLNADTDVELHLESAELTNRGAMDAKLTVDHAIDDRNSIKPVFSLKTGDVRYEYVRKLGDDAELVAHVNPGTDVDVQWVDQGSRGLWTTNLKMPWANPAGATMSVKRKFSF